MPARRLCPPKSSPDYGLPGFVDKPSPSAPGSGAFQAQTFGPWPQLFTAMLLRVGLCSLHSMLVRVLVVCTSYVGVMRGLLMVAGLVVLCRFLVVTSRMFEMLCCLEVMLCYLFRHVMLLLWL